MENTTKVLIGVSIALLIVAVVLLIVFLARPAPSALTRRRAAAAAAARRYPPMIKERYTPTQTPGEKAAQIKNAIARSKAVAAANKSAPRTPGNVIGGTVNALNAARNLMNAYTTTFKVTQPTGDTLNKSCVPPVGDANKAAYDAAKSSFDSNLATLVGLVGTEGAPGTLRKFVTADINAQAEQVVTDANAYLTYLENSPPCDTWCATGTSVQGYDAPNRICRCVQGYGEQVVDYTGRKVTCGYNDENSEMTGAFGAVNAVGDTINTTMDASKLVKMSYA